MQKPVRERRKLSLVASTTDLESPPERLVSKGEILERTGLSFPTVWKLMRDGKFPLARIVGGRSMWLASEVDAWIGSLPVRRYKSNNGDGDA